MQQKLPALGLAAIALIAVAAAEDAPKAKPAEAITIEVVLEKIDFDARRVTAQSFSNQISPKESVGGMVKHGPVAAHEQPGLMPTLFENVAVASDAKIIEDGKEIAFKDLKASTMPVKLKLTVSPQGVLVAAGIERLEVQTLGVDWLDALPPAKK